MYQKLYGFIDKEMNDLGNRVVANGKLSMQEVQYVDLLAHLEKSLLTSEAMKKAENRECDKDKDEQHNDNVVRYAESSEGSVSTQYKSNMISELYNLMSKAPNEQTKHRLEEFIFEVERMN